MWASEASRQPIGVEVNGVRRARRDERGVRGEVEVLRNVSDDPSRPSLLDLVLSEEVQGAEQGLRR